MNKKFKKEILIGISVLVALVALFFGINYLKGINIFKAANYYYASYTNVVGLTVSSPVTINGFKVGLVREIEYEYNNPGNILVELSLDKQLRIPHGTKAQLKTDILGTASIELLITNSSTYYEVGEKIAGTNNVGLMDNMSNDLLPSVVSMLPKIDSLLSVINTLVSDPAIANSIRRLDNITANLETSSEQLDKIMKAMSPTMSNVNKISENLNVISSDLSEITTELNNCPIDSTIENIYYTTENFKEISAKLNSNNSSMGLLLNDSTLYKNLNNAAGNLDSLLIDVKKNPKRYISIKLL